ncbi:MAG: dihydroneopterin aldolase [Chthoniobacterales bacterium]|nr:dihydroneopterin aldolase [Chthoniobacterales bacterium]
MQIQVCEKIIIHSLEILSRIGVPSEERSSPQRLLIDVEIFPSNSFVSIDDSIEKTIDYSQIALQITTLASQRPRNLIETLAWECAKHIFDNFLVNKVTVRVRKFILPNADFVAAEVTISNPTPSVK